MDWQVPLETGERLLPSHDELRAMRDEEVVARINGLIESVENGHVSTQVGADKVAVIVRVQYLTQELARREQDRQTEIMVSHAATVKNCIWGITIMTILIMVATVWGMVHSH